MKRIKQILGFAIVIGLTTSCTESANSHSENSTQKDMHEGHNHDNEESITLDNGKKWIVVEEMMTHIHNMEKEVKEFKDDNYSKLAKSLTNHINLLTSNCTMTGQAHDELHKWLLPYIDMVEDLSESKDKMEAAENFKRIQDSFKLFNTYFI